MMNRRRRVMFEWLIFGGLFLGFALFMWIWFQTSPAVPADFSK